MWLKRLIRPLIPDRLVARYRLHQHSRQVRTNVDVFVETDRDRRRWLAVTPDSYRVGLQAGLGDAADPELVVLGPGDEADVAARAASSTGADAGVVASTSVPRLLARRRAEPAIEAIAMAVRPAALREVGGERSDLVGLLRRLRDAGHRIALVPRVDGSVEERRTARINRPTVLLLAAVPMHDVGGGSRAARLAVEFVVEGFHVVYVSVFGTSESVDLGLRFVHPHLEQYRTTDFDVANLEKRVEGPGLVLAEVPHPALTELVDRHRRTGWKVVYDVIDRWEDPALGGNWYRPDVEAGFIFGADAVVASSADLVDRVSALGARATLVANAVDAGLFAVSQDQMPADFPPGDGPVIGYHGSLYGDWIDWEAIASVAHGFPKARVVLVGDASRAPSGLPGNVHLLGMKPQHLLPGYLALFDVGLVPFAVTDTTHAVSPLKVYEYLACGVPVAAPPLRALLALDGVHVAGNLVEAVAGAMAAEPPNRVQVLRDHSWDARLVTLLDAADVGRPASMGSRPTVVQRPVVHHPPAERRL